MTRKAAPPCSDRRRHPGTSWQTCKQADRCLMSQLHFLLPTSLCFVESSTLCSPFVFFTPPAAPQMNVGQFMVLVCLAFLAYVCLPARPSAYLSVCRPVRLTECLSKYLSDSLSYCLSVWLSAWPSKCLHDCLSVFQLSICLTVCLSAWVSV